MKKLAISAIITAIFLVLPAAPVQSFDLGEYAQELSTEAPVVTEAPVTEAPVEGTGFSLPAPAPEAETLGAINNEDEWALKFYETTPSPEETTSVTTTVTEETTPTVTTTVTTVTEDTTPTVITTEEETTPTVTTTVTTEEITEEITEEEETTPVETTSKKHETVPETEESVPETEESVPETEESVPETTPVVTTSISVSRPHEATTPTKPRNPKTGNEDAVRVNWAAIIGILVAIIAPICSISRYRCLCCLPGLREDYEKR